MITQTEQALGQLLAESESLPLMGIVGAPLRFGQQLYNCAVVFSAGKICGVVPKTYLANYREFYEKRHFAAGYQLGEAVWESELPGAAQAPVGPQIFRPTQVPHLRVGVEVCEDLWVPISPSSHLALNGANLICNLSSSPVTVGRADRRKLLCQAASAKNICAYLYAAAGNGESANDLSWDGQTLIYANGQLLAETERFPRSAQASLADINLRDLDNQRQQTGSFADNAFVEGEGSLPSTPVAWSAETWFMQLASTGGQTGQIAEAGQVREADQRAGMNQVVSAGSISEVDLGSAIGQATGADLAPRTGQISGLTPAADAETSVNAENKGAVNQTLAQLIPPVDRFPFVPNDLAQLDQDCSEAYRIQVYGLVRRCEAIGNPKLVIGISGGLDSTHALIVAARSLDLLGQPRSQIKAYTLPGFATSATTKANAYRLCESLGIKCKEIDIRPAAQQILSDLGHPYAQGQQDYDVTFENVQAGLRTDYLFRLANHLGGIVVGTGDLSELALGWCTYGVGDHMSHYSVNPGVPKTLIQHLIRWVAKRELFGAGCSQVLLDILNTEISPELIPSAPGQKIQSTQDKIGPYELHDFFLYYLLRGTAPRDIAYLADQAWSNKQRGDWPDGIEVDQRHQYNLGTIVHWLEQFYRRFAAAQFKRTCVPNGPKVSSGGSLSPRGDWRMPADVNLAAWRSELAQLRNELGIDTAELGQ